MNVLPSFLPSLRPLTFGLEILSFLVSCILRVDWRTKSEREAKGRRSERRAAAGEHRLNDCSFQRVICPARTYYPDSLMSRSRIRFGGYIHGMTGRGRSGL